MCFAILLSPEVNKMNVFVPQFGEFDFLETIKL